MTGWCCGVLLASFVLVYRPARPRHRLAGLAPPPPTRPGPAAAAVALAAVAGSGVVAAGLPLPLAVGAGLVAAVAARMRRRRRELQRRRAREAACVEVTAGLAAELRAGRTPPDALRALAGVPGALSADLTDLVAVVAAGGVPQQELARLATREGTQRLAPVAGVWAAAEAAGAQVAPVLDALAAAMDADDELRRDLEAELAGPRSTVVVLAALPMLGLALGSAVGAHPLRLLVHRPLGWALLTAACLLELAGVAAMRGVSRWAVPP